MYRRLPLLLLASLLLFWQLASSALQLCLEEDGSVTVELTLLDCGTVEAPKVLEKTVGPCSSLQFAQLESSFVDLCLDFSFSLNLRKATSARASIASISFRVEEFYPLGIASISAPSETAIMRLYATDSCGMPAPPWLEHGEMLAKIHGRETVVMRC